MMNAPHLMRLFVAIAEYESLSAVARSWGVAPSTVTHGLKRLEDRLGVQLVLRTTRHLSLTPEGERFLDDCRRILSDIEEVMTGFSDHEQLSGTIRVTATHDFGRQRIAGIADAFMRTHPDLKIQLFLSDALVDLVDEGFDLGIRTGPLRDSDMKARLLMRGRKCVCASPDYWDRVGRPKHPRELVNYNCLTFATPGEAQSFWPFREGDETFRVRISGDRTVNDGQTLRQWAIAGAGVAVKSYFDIAEDLASGRLETALDAFTSDATNLYAVFPPRGHEPRRVRAFLDFLSAELDDHGAASPAEEAVQAS